MASDNFEQDKQAFTQHVTDRIKKRVRAAISSALLSIVADHDVFVASGLQVDVEQLMKDEALAAVQEHFKED